MAKQIKARLVSAPQPRTDGYGLGHNMFVAVGDNDVMHLPCVIPLERYAELLAGGMSEFEIGELYKALIIEFYNVGVPSPTIPQPPSGLSDLGAVEDYFDTVEAYEAQRDQNVADATTYANIADNWIRSLSSFTGDYPFDFVLQSAS